MTLFAFRGAKSPAWTFCDPINVDNIHHHGSNQGRRSKSIVTENSEATRWEAAHPTEIHREKQKACLFSGNILYCSLTWTVETTQAGIKVHFSPIFQWPQQQISMKSLS